MQILSLNSQSEAACAKLLEEVDSQCAHPDPLDELIAEEEEFDVDSTCIILNAIHRRAHGRGCSFPQCYIPCGSCTKTGV